MSSCINSVLYGIGGRYGAHIIHGAANAMYLPKGYRIQCKDERTAEKIAVIADTLQAKEGRDED